MSTKGVYAIDHGQNDCKGNSCVEICIFQEHCLCIHQGLSDMPIADWSFSNFQKPGRTSKPAQIYNPLKQKRTLRPEHKCLFSSSGTWRNEIFRIMFSSSFFWRVFSTYLTRNCTVVNYCASYIRDWSVGEAWWLTSATAACFVVLQAARYRMWGQGVSVRKQNQKGGFSGLCCWNRI